MTMLRRQTQKARARLSRYVGFIHEARTDDIRADAEFRQVYDTCRPYTMTSMSRMYALHQAVRHVLAHDVPGDLVECGVWRGGSAMVMATALDDGGHRDRRLYLYDTYEGMSEPTDRDVDARGKSAQSLLQTHDKDDPIWAEASLEEVRHNLATTGLPPSRSSSSRATSKRRSPTSCRRRSRCSGWTPTGTSRRATSWSTCSRCWLRAAFSSSTTTGTGRARAAVDEYFAETRPQMLLNRIDFTGRIGVKIASG